MTSEVVIPRQHFLLLPFPAYGHMIPLAELGKKIARHHDVTFAVSQCLFGQLQKRELVSPKDFTLVCIPDGLAEQLDGANVLYPANFVTTLQTVIAGIQSLLQAVPTRGSVGNPANGLGITIPVDFVIGDNMMAAGLSVCRDREIPLHFFNTCAASLTFAVLAMTEDYPVLGPNEEPNQFMELPSSPGASPPPIPEISKKVLLDMRRATLQVNGIIFNSALEVERDTVALIEALSEMKGISLRCVGPLMSPAEKLSTAKLEHKDKVQAWLDRQSETSVVYVSFGSIAYPSPEQIAELAKALLRVGKPFIWSIRPEQQQHLPEGIKSKMGNQFEGEGGSFLILGWAPQKLILQHASTAVFLSHCGWNSTMESVSAGVPVVAWPMFADQKLNAEWLAKQSTAVMVEGTGLKPKRLVLADEIEGIISDVGWNGGARDSACRIAAQSWSSKLGKATGSGGSSDIAFRELIGLPLPHNGISTVTGNNNN
ncbi:putative Cinnamate beta-D-glucosyltransferase [Hypsibius exemplaris]|uniref:UDP-glucuronosyltransferase n=1 Tax=Hypsibius exemplaris TaxID=2072580 RepID=A0A1W0WKU8_HYPEX|nr:putative Cinnamate beta-D-glucosyltransferase [Hypsibius exemplaris]